MHQKSESPLLNRPKKFQLGIRQLLFATALIAAGLVIGPSSIIPTVMILIAWTAIFLNRSKHRSYLLVFVVCVLGFCFCSGPFMSTYVREAARRTACQNNMRLIMLAIQNYERDNGHFPTDRVVITSEGTKLRHSWRISILPYLENTQLFESYNFDEPWNGPNNAKLAKELRWSPFFCPSHETGVRTPYRLVNGTGTAFENDRQISFDDVADGTSNTIALVEDSTNPVHWMEPKEYSAEEASNHLNSLGLQNCAHVAESTFERRFIGSNLALLDGSVLLCRPNLELPVEPGAFLIDDGIFLSTVDGSGTLREIKYGSYVALFVYVGLSLLPAFYLRSQTRNEKTHKKESSGIDGTIPTDKTAR